MDLWKRLVGQPSPLSGESTSLLASDLERLNDVSPKLGTRALRFVADGTDGDVLDALPAARGSGEALHLKCARQHGAGRFLDRAPFFRSLSKPDALLCLRLALVYEAASRGGQRSLKLTWVPGAPEWLEVFLWEASTFQPDSYGGRPEVFVDHGLVETMLVLAERAPDTAVRGALLADPQQWNILNVTEMLSTMPGFAEAAARHPQVVQAALAQTDTKRRAYVLQVLVRRQVQPQPHLDQLVDLALCSAKTVRTEAQALLQLIPDGAEERVRGKAIEGTASERGLAVALLWSLRHVSARPFLEERLEKEQSEKIRRVIEGLIGSAQPAASATGENAFILPPSKDQVPGTLTDATRSALRRLCDSWHTAACANIRKLLFQNARWRIPEPAPVDEALLDRILSRMQKPILEKGDTEPLWTPSSDWRWRLDDAQMLRFIETSELDLLHVVRFLGASGYLGIWARALQKGAELDRYLWHYRASHGLRFGLREVGAALRASGIDPTALGWSRLDGDWRWHAKWRWEPEAIWPYFLEHGELLEETFGLRPPSAPDERGDWIRAVRRTNALAVLETFPRVPPRLQAKVWDVALGGAKADRLAAQRSLEREPQTPERVIAALVDGRQEVRTIAADWLARLGDARGLVPLEVALRKEKHDVPKGALMNALEALGAPVEQFLDRPGLAADAAKALRKGIPPGIAWFPFDRLPLVHWADTGEAVPTEVLTWLIVQAHKLGSPEPGALLRRYGRQIAEAETLGCFVLEAWIAHDIVLPTRQEALAKAQPLAAQTVRYYFGKTLQEVTEMLVEGFLNQPKGSAVGDKGVLAVAGACAGAGAAPLVGQYLKRWYGYRAAQCRALLQMLSWVDHPAAIQLVLATATRFRTAGIRKEAEKQTQLIAERKGWTVAELSDRTIPTAGFDEEGVIELDYGARRFLARLDDALEIVLTNAEGKTISGLPEPKADEAAETVAAAKATLGNARKELKTAVKLQRERLYEAMCTERAWSFEDCDTYLQRHPIVGRFCRRLVWMARVGAGAPIFFRPVGDGSLTNSTDDNVTLPRDAVVRLAHSSNTPEPEAQAWRDHMAAFEIEPLFEQFGRALLRLPPERLLETKAADFEGHMLRAYKLRARATKLGYTRGQNDDGAWFSTYRKHFTTLGLAAVIEFTGNSLPEEDRPVALCGLSFVRSADGAGPSGPEIECALGEVPAVLLSECWNDVKTIAAEGTGFDPEWEKKVHG